MKPDNLNVAPAGIRMFFRESMLLVVCGDRVDVSQAVFTFGKGHKSDVRSLLLACGEFELASSIYNPKTADAGIMGYAPEGLQKLADALGIEIEYCTRDAQGMPGKMLTSRNPRNLKSTDTV